MEPAHNAGGTQTTFSGAEVATSDASVRVCFYMIGLNQTGIGDRRQEGFHSGTNWRQRLHRRSETVLAVRPRPSIAQTAPVKKGSPNGQGGLTASEIKDMFCRSVDTVDPINVTRSLTLGADPNTACYSFTLPSMSYRPQAFGCFCRAGWICLPLLPKYHAIASSWP
jgi:hypothetical protein